MPRKIDPQPATVDPQPKEHPPAGGVISTPPPAIPGTTPTLPSRVEEWDALSMRVVALAETVNDVEVVRIAISHRIKAWERKKFTSAQLQALTATLDEQLNVEAAVVKRLEAAMKDHPLAPWVAASKGVGLKQAARLLAAIGNPFWNHAEDRPRRGPAELWAYCGMHVISTSVGHCSTDTQGRNADAGGPFSGSGHSVRDSQTATAAAGALLPADRGARDPHTRPVGGHLLHPGDQCGNDAHGSPVAGVAPRRAKGERANWNAAARMRARLVAESCVKQDSSAPYRVVYELGRKKYADAVHSVDCSQCGMCGTCGKPPGLGRAEHEATGCPNRKVVKATAGSELRDGHKHARALRLVAKEVLKDLYLASRDWHLAEP